MKEYIFKSTPYPLSIECSFDPWGKSVACGSHTEYVVSVRIIELW